MNRSWFCSAILLVGSLSLCVANEASEVLDSDLKTWNRLKRDAGYYTESGLWRGGLYRKTRTTETEQYHCLEHTDTHCTGWNVSERRHHKHETGNCRCNETSSPFCQQWTCNTSFEYGCGTSDNPATCIAKEELNCDCVTSAMNERYCWKWRCREDSNTMPGGYHEDEDYECIVGDVTAEYCFRWHGNTTSKYQLESSACQCLERGQSFCHYWQCRERALDRCSQSRQGWCRLEVSIAVGGGLGLLTFACSVGVSLAFTRCQDDRVTPKVVLLLFVLCCLPWFVGVVIWGGIFGIPWVLLMWSIGLFAVYYKVKWVDAKLQDPKSEKSARGLQNTTKVEVISVHIKKPPAAGDKHFYPSGG